MEHAHPQECVLRGQTKFSEFERRLGIALEHPLASGLESFVAAGLMELRPNPEHKGQNEYVLTEKGRDSVPALVARRTGATVGPRPDGPPIVYEHEACQGEVRLELRCSACSEVVTPEAIKARPGPGFRAEICGWLIGLGWLLVDSISSDNTTGFESRTRLQAYYQQGSRGGARTNNPHFLEVSVFGHFL